MKIYIKQNHVEGVIRQVRKFWLTTSGILLWKVYGLLKFIWDKSYTSFKNLHHLHEQLLNFPDFCNFKSHRRFFLFHFGRIQLQYFWIIGRNALRSIKYSLYSRHWKTQKMQFIICRCSCRCDFEHMLFLF